MLIINHMGRLDGKDSVKGVIGVGKISRFTDFEAERL